MDLLNVGEHDALAETLSAIRVQSSVYCLSELRAPWGFRVDGAATAKFHLVLDGVCWLEVDGLDPVRLNAPELVVIVGGQAHVMRDEPGSRVQPLDSMIADNPLDASSRLSYGGTGATTRLLCGGFQLAAPVPARLLAGLPSIVRLNYSRSDVGGWIDPLVTLVRQEADRAAPGAQAIFAKLADVFLSQALRNYLTEMGQDGLHLTTTPDAQIEKAVDLLQQWPDRHWTLEQLAREVGLSRTLLATRFRDGTGDSPMRHLTKIRLGQAADYLTTADLSLEAIARRTGYANDTSLSKAFKREFGVSPGTYRRRKGNVAELIVS